LKEDGVNPLHATVVFANRKPLRYKQVIMLNLKEITDFLDCTPVGRPLAMLNQTVGALRHTDG
jgi:hypothetical protein